MHHGRKTIWCLEVLKSSNQEFCCSVALAPPLLRATEGMSLHLVVRNHPSSHRCCCSGAGLRVPATLGPSRPEISRGWWLLVSRTIRDHLVILFSIIRWNGQGGRVTVSTSLRTQIFTPPQHILNLMSVYVLLWIVIIIYLECKHPLVFSVLQ